MAEVILSYEGSVSDQDGHGYSVQACGRPLNETVWEGWLEFLPDDGTAALRTSRETTQPNRDDLAYWASGLELVYLEGALRRALRPQRAASPSPAGEQPVYEGPAPHDSHAHEGRHAALDPFHVHASQGDEILRRQLAALELWQLRNVAIVHTPVSESQAEGMDREALTHEILSAVRN